MIWCKSELCLLSPIPAFEGSTCLRIAAKTGGLKDPSDSMLLWAEKLYFFIKIS